ncbi:MAG: hypothetical protein NZ480_02605 [Bdellovibrionaceae bacterium]|nr:hypothetical protein [Pseudobdellovibrionaceae bacterium]MDW8190952.1 hypothetical protein [Pseudobdellovibrionaceae bacterium]
MQIKFVSWLNWRMSLLAFHLITFVLVTQFVGADQQLIETYKTVYLTQDNSDRFIQDQSVYPFMAVEFSVNELVEFRKGQDYRIKSYTIFLAICVFIRNVDYTAAPAINTPAPKSYIKLYCTPGIEFNPADFYVVRNSQTYEGLKKETLKNNIDVAYSKNKNFNDFIFSNEVFGTFDSWYPSLEKIYQSMLTRRQSQGTWDLFFKDLPAVKWRENILTLNENCTYSLTKNRQGSIDVVKDWIKISWYPFEMKSTSDRASLLGSGMFFFLDFAVKPGSISDHNRKNLFQLFRSSDGNPSTSGLLRAPLTSLRFHSNYVSSNFMSTPVPSNQGMMVSRGSENKTPTDQNKGKVLNTSQRNEKISYPGFRCWVVYR